MSTAQHILTRLIDRFYFPFLSRWIPLQTFRYAFCGGANLVLSWVFYLLTYNFVLRKQIVELGFIAISAHVATLLITFPITFLTGFWLQRSIPFRASPLPRGVQLFRYLLSVLGSLLLNYVCLKFFVEAMHIYPTPSQILSSLITIAYSYLMQKYFTFRGSADE